MPLKHISHGPCSINLKSNWGKINVALGLNVIDENIKCFRNLVIRGFFPTITYKGSQRFYMKNYPVAKDELKYTFEKTYENGVSYQELLSYYGMIYFCIFLAFLCRYI